MTLRLTKSDRDGVVNRALEHGFATRVSTLAAEEDALAIAAYEHLFPAAERKAAAAMPKKWVRQDSCLRFVFSYRQTRLRTLKPVPVPSTDYGCSVLGTIRDDALNARFMAYVGQEEDLKRDREKVRADLSAIIDRCRTLNALREAWPEGEPFYRHLTPRAATPLPAVQIESINAMLGLAEAA